MSFLSKIIKLSVVVAFAAGSFGGTQLYMVAKAEAEPVIVKADSIAAKLAEDSDLTGAKLRPMSPIYATTKYKKAELAGPTVKTPTKKVATRTANTMPMRIAYAPEARVADRAAPIYANIR